jgi:hypothetical protein
LLISFVLQEMVPQHSIQDLVYMLYPYDLMLGLEGQKVVQDAMKVSYQFKYSKLLTNILYINLWIKLL